MRNPFSRLVRQDGNKPTLRERAAALKSSAARAIRNRRDVIPEPADAADPVLVSMVAEWQALRARLNNGTIEMSDEEAGPLHKRWVELHLAVYSYSAATLADLQAKVPVLLDEVATLKGSSESPSPSLSEAAWRGVLADIGRLSRTPDLEAKAGPVGSLPNMPKSGICDDYELLALGREFDVVHAEWTLAVRACREAERRIAALQADLTSRPGWRRQEAHDVAWAQPDVARTADIQEDVCLRMDAITAQIRALPARTVDGIAVKARAAIPAVWRNGEYERDAGLGDDEDWIELNARSLIDECLALAGVDWTGRRFRAVARASEGSSSITSEASASEVDLSGLGINDLCSFYETLKAARALWSGAMCQPLAIASTDPLGCVDHSAFGKSADFEDSRIGFLMDQVATEAAGRTPADRYERDNLIALRIEQEIACEGRILDTALLADIAQAWG